MVHPERHGLSPGQGKIDYRFCRQKRFQIINLQNGPVKITTKGVEPKHFE